MRTFKKVLSGIALIASLAALIAVFMHKYSATDNVRVLTIYTEAE